MNLTTKIIDNMQINITNIHVRYEDTKFFKKPLSIGLTLQRLQIHTTDEKWKEAFFDRTLAKNKTKPI
jgi:vacuolar protein sorting-associated protein 13A/C